MTNTADTNGKRVNQGEICRRCGTFTHVEGSKHNDFPLGRYDWNTGAHDLTAKTWHDRGSCVEGPDGH